MRGAPPVGAGPPSSSLSPGQLHQRQADLTVSGPPVLHPVSLAHCFQTHPPESETTSLCSTLSWPSLLVAGTRPDHLACMGRGLSVTSCQPPCGLMSLCPNRLSSKSGQASVDPWTHHAYFSVFTIVPDLTHPEKGKGLRDSLPGFPTAETMVLRLPTVLSKTHVSPSFDPFSGIAPMASSLRLSACLPQRLASPLLNEGGWAQKSVGNYILEEGPDGELGCHWTEGQQGSNWVAM